MVSNVLPNAMSVKVLEVGMVMHAMWMINNKWMINTHATAEQGMRHQVSW